MLSDIWKNFSDRTARAIPRQYRHHIYIYGKAAVGIRNMFPELENVKIIHSL
jgi:hypothetical protein